VLALLLVSATGLLFSFQMAKAIETIHIQVDGTIYPDTAPIQRDGSVYRLTGDINSDVDGIVIEKNDTILDGAGYTIQGTNSPLSKGIYLSGSYDVTIKNMNINAFESGILLDAYSTYNNILGNIVEGNDYVISCWAYSDNNTIKGNNITVNNLAGIWIVGSSYNVISQNIIADNSQYGISLEDSSNNTVFHNKFIENANQTHIYDSTNLWDNGYSGYSSGGNYWSDYNGIDANHDFFGDTPYIIDDNNVDNYPLMYIYWNPCDINHDLLVNMKDVAGAAKAFSTVPGDPLWNPHADITGPSGQPDGKVNMMDIGLIARNFGKTY
jgi:parallel beta-helix repeat protein